MLLGIEMLEFIAQGNGRWSMTALRHLLPFRADCWILESGHKVSIKKKELLAKVYRCIWLAIFGRG
jgi:hypothetical protein